MRILLILYIVLQSFWCLSQDLIPDSSFLFFGNYQNSATVSDWKQASCSKGGAVKPFSTKNESELKFEFRVSSISVDPNFILVKMNEEMVAGAKYRVSLSVRKSRFSSLNLRELQVYFGASYNETTSFLHGMADLQLLNFKLDSVKTERFTTLILEYKAQGGEEFIYLGSLYQRFNIAESTQLGLMMADRTYQELPYNCSYYVDYISLVKEVSDDEQLENSLLQNSFNIKSDLSNLILNGGAETVLKKKYFTNAVTSQSTGSLIAPYVYSLNQFAPEVHQLDSNDYRSEYDLNQLCYMGDGQFNLDALSTNAYHTYQAVRERVEGKEYDTYYIYEEVPYQQIMPYAYGEYLVFCLKEPMEKGVEYNWSSMIKLSEAASFGIPYLGVHFLDSFPENQKDSLWQRSPEILVNVEHLSTTQAWNEFNYNYLAKGGEKFVVIGHLAQLEGIRTNQNFKRQFRGDCGPHDYNCVDRYVHFKDSLFARYQFDNLVLVKSSEADNLSVVYEAGKRVQLEVIFTEVLKSDSSEIKLENVQNVLINAQQVLRAEDAICIVDLHKNEPVTLEPNPIINKKKIIRKIAKPKPVKKIKIETVPLEMILFGAGVDEVNLNYLVLVGDESLNLTEVQERLYQFMINGGHVVVYYIGDNNKFYELKSRYASLDTINWILSDQLSPFKMVELLIGKD